MQVFFYLCEYLRITPQEFFDQNVTYPLLLKETMVELEKMNPEQLEHILNIARDINNTKSSSQKR